MRSTTDPSELLILFHSDINSKSAKYQKFFGSLFIGGQLDSLFQNKLLIPRSFLAFSGLNSFI